MQASAYFAPETTNALEEALISFGERRLGCRAITPVWMSFYTDGMVQVGLRDLFGTHLTCTLISTELAGGPAPTIELRVYASLSDGCVHWTTGTCRDVPVCISSQGETHAVCVSQHAKVPASASCQRSLLSHPS